MKHQEQVPAVFIAFFNISATGDGSQDEQVKTDVNSIRTSLSRSGYKTRLAVVLISDRSIVQAPQMEERLSSIRRLTSLDSKTGLFFMPPMSSQAEISTFVQTLMTALQPLCVEFYRDLTKHARRKKARGGSTQSVSSTAGAGAQSLSTPGWNVRYEVKQGVFAEIRQEMDVAERHYSSAIDELFNAEGVLEFTPSWSPRWDEARLLSDCLALRILKCQLWSALTTAAAQSWIKYKARMGDLIDRRGKGTQTYSWAAWEARWAEVMGQLIQRAEVPALQAAIKEPEENSELEIRQFYAMPEKTYTSMERIPPFNYLHHSGYWLKLANRSTRTRRKRALEIPEEDRTPPAQSPASAVASRSRNYDCYLVSDPHEELDGARHVTTLTTITNAASEQFQSRGQNRMTEIMRLDLAHDLAELERYEDAIHVLVPLWQETSWRNDGWHDIFAEMLLLLRQCAETRNDMELLLASTYELLSIQAPLPTDIAIDLSHCVDGKEGPSSHAFLLKYHDRERLSPVAISFAFDGKETHVGESLRCQLRVTSCANQKSVPITLSNITLHFGASKTMRIIHDSEDSAVPEEMIDLVGVAKDIDGSLEAKANLTFEAGQQRLFNFNLVFRDAGDVSLKETVVLIETERFTIEHTLTNEHISKLNSIFTQRGNETISKFLRHADTTTITVLPKPPKVRLQLQRLRKQYYTDEMVRLIVDIINEEAEAVSGELHVLVSEDSDVALPLQLIDDSEPSDIHDSLQQIELGPAHKTIAQLQPDASHQAGILIQAPSEPLKTAVLITLEYTLSSDSSTTLRKTAMLELSFISAFKAKFNFRPLLYPDAWPSYFDQSTGKSSGKSEGIPQLWRLSSQLHSVASESIVVRSVETIMDSIAGDSLATSEGIEHPDRHTLEPGKFIQYAFNVRTQKHSLEDRRPTTVDCTLATTWALDQESESITTRIPVPRLTLPVSEPRVLCTLADYASSDDDVILHYHIENPSMHFLTFALTMEASEEFGFSGPKYRALSLAPLSRHRVEYRIIVHGQDDSSTEESKWIWPSLQIIDSYYQKTLRVHPGGPGVKLDDKQNIGVFIGDA